MARRRRQSSFAEIIDRAKAEPPRAVAVRPGVVRWLAFTHRDGRSFELVARQIDPATALTEAASGALVVGDVCGCGGGVCQLDWYDAEQVRRMVETGPAELLPTRRHGHAELSLWQSPDGDRLILASGPVRWAPVLDQTR